MSQKLPAMPWYVGDWLKDPVVRGMTFEERGFWFDLINIFWEMPERGRLAFKNGEAIPTERLARMIGADIQYVNLKIKLLVNLGVIVYSSDGVLEAVRIRRDEQLRTVRKETGKLGGNPKLLKNNKRLVKCKVNQNTENEYENEIENEYENKKQKIDILDMSSFSVFWTAYPRKDGKSRASDVWSRLVKSGQVDDAFLRKVIGAVEAQKSSKSWTKDGGEFIPLAATWLNGRRWEDEGVKGIKEPPPKWTKRYTDAMLPLDSDGAEENNSDFFGDAVEVKPETESQK